MIINLTQHPATAEQADAGVADLPAEMRADLIKLLTFDRLEEAVNEVTERAEKIAALAEEYLDVIGVKIINRAALVGGAPFLMAPLEGALRRRAINPVYAFSKRESIEERLPDGSVRKTAVFRHAGFVPAFGEGHWPY